MGTCVGAYGLTLNPALRLHAETGRARTRRTRYTDTVNKQESINIATYLQLHMTGTPGYTYLPTYARKTNNLLSLHLLYLLMYHYGRADTDKKVLTRPTPT